MKEETKNEALESTKVLTSLRNFYCTVVLGTKALLSVSPNSNDTTEVRCDIHCEKRARVRVSSATNAKNKYWIFISDKQYLSQEDGVDEENFRR